jgi:hypothetical protein
MGLVFTSSACVSRKFKNDGTLSNLEVDLIHDTWPILLFGHPSDPEKICGCPAIAANDGGRICKAEVDPLRECLAVRLFEEQLRLGVAAYQKPESRDRELAACRAELALANQTLESYEAQTVPDGFGAAADVTLARLKAVAAQAEENCIRLVNLMQTMPVTDETIAQFAKETIQLIREKNISIKMHRLKEIPESKIPYNWNQSSEFVHQAWFAARALHQRGEADEYQEALSEALMYQSFRVKIGAAQLSRRLENHLIVYRKEKEVEREAGGTHGLFAGRTKTTDSMPLLRTESEGRWYASVLPDRQNSLDSGGPACMVGLMKPQAKAGEDLIQIAGEYAYEATGFTGSPGNTAFVLRSIGSNSTPVELVVQCGFVEKVVMKLPSLGIKKDPFIDFLVLSPTTQKGDSTIEFKLGHVMSLFRDFQLLARPPVQK